MHSRTQNMFLMTITLLSDQFSSYWIAHLFQHPLKRLFPLPCKPKMTKTAPNQSREQRIQQAIELVRIASTYRQAEAATKIACSTISNCISSEKPEVVQAHRNSSLLDTPTPVDEDLVVTLLIRYAELSLPLCRPSQRSNLDYCFWYTPS